MNILNEIVSQKRKEVERKKSRTPRFEMTELSPTRDFQSALAGEGISLIAEIKRFSPSNQQMHDDFDPVRIAAAYEESGAAAISVLTDEKYFGGRDSYVGAVKERVRLPILRKEFIVDEYQIYESRHLGADAILLIASILERSEISSCLALASTLGLACLVEAHTEAEVEKALVAGGRIIGINNRNLDTLQVDLETSIRLSEKIPTGIVAISESGITTRSELLRLQDAGFAAALIGQVLMSSADMDGKLEELLGR